MKIESIKFIAGVTATNVEAGEIIKSDLPTIAFIGRSNVGKSSLINALTRSDIAKTSGLPGSTQQINVFLINEKIRLVDLPGYGFARGSIGDREKMRDLIKSYLFNPAYTQKKVVLVIDASVGMTERDESMFQELKKANKNIVIAASKIDTLNQSERHRAITSLAHTVSPFPLYPVSSKTRAGLDDLSTVIFD